MAKQNEFSRNWWGQRFIEALESFTETNRLSRGRSYARGNKVKSFTIADGHITAKVRGSVNPYFGVYKEPLYTTEIEFPLISEAQWAAIIALIATKAGFLSKLMMNEIPENIEEPFKTLGIHLLPQRRSDIITRCSCPDYSNPCKHIAGVYYLIAAELDRDPFLLFELRGIPRDRFQSLLAESPLGKAMSQGLNRSATPLTTIESFYPRPQLIPAEKPPSLKEFWMGSQSLPKESEPIEAIPISGILLKKQGDFPPFWEHQTSFLELMEEIYNRVKNNNKDIF
ncbi:SWIM zinc finger family protein [Alkalinema sp. FACHB-956]|uniref:SWIM zinc finger family protein n=1 Tax=Alkalinema sp. FACHB-956 TaxID=2692768 RepID=UPI001684D89F|nr:SWIM zinc finger family protein [Alkalinema sp. FACHB-956]MBD2328657.1 SWIM zinc finger family protein [Alkalinema sp. FACHB-956]